MKIAFLLLTLAALPMAFADSRLLGPGGSGGGDVDAVEFLYKSLQFQQWAAKNPDTARIDTKATAFSLEKIIASMDLGDVNNINPYAKPLLTFTDGVPPKDCENYTKEACFNRARGSITVVRSQWRAMDEAKKYILIATELNGLVASGTLPGSNRYLQAMVVMGNWQKIAAENVDLPQLLTRRYQDWNSIEKNLSSQLQGVEAKIDREADASRLVDIFSGAERTSDGLGLVWAESEFGMIGLNCNVSTKRCSFRIRRHWLAEQKGDQSVARMTGWHMWKFGGSVFAAAEILDSKDSKAASLLYQLMKLSPKVTEDDHCTISRKEFVDSESLMKISCQQQSCRGEEAPEAFCRFSIAAGKDAVSGYEPKLAETPAGVVTTLNKRVYATINNVEVPPFHVFTSDRGLTFTSLLGAGFSPLAEKACYNLGEARGTWRLPTPEEAAEIIDDVGRLPSSEFGTKNAPFVSRRANPIGSVQDYVYTSLYSGLQHIHYGAQDVAYLCVKN